MGLTPIITRYMAKNFLIYFVVVLFALLTLTALFDGIELLRRTVARPQVNMVAIIEMTLLKLPSMMHVLLPFVILISALLVLLRLNKSHELIIIRAAGVSAWQFIAPLLIMSFLIGVLNVTLFNPFAAACFKRYEAVENSFGMGSSNPLNLSGDGLWIKETRGDVIYTIHAESLKQKGESLEMRDMSVFETDLSDAFKRRIEAEEGKLENNNLFLKKVWIMEAEKSALSKTEMTLPTVLSLDKIQDNFSSPETVSFWTIPTFIKFFEQTGFSSLKHKLHWYSLMISPLFLCAMVLIACVFSVSVKQRQGRVLFKVIGALISGFVLFFFAKFIYALGASATIPLTMAVWSPSLIAITLCLFVLLHYEDG